MCECEFCGEYSGVFQFLLETGSMMYEKGDESKFACHLISENSQ